MPRPRPSVSIDTHVPGTGWFQHASCLGLDAGLFFPLDRTGFDVAVKVCEGCPVRAQCLEYALEQHELYGVWGGCSERERRRIAKARRLKRVA